MLSKEILAKKLSPFLGTEKTLVLNQDTGDIIDGIVSMHDKYKSEYDKIYKYFVGDNVDDTAYNIWCYLKDNFKYNIESEDLQVLRSPASIMNNKVGIDCKNYSLAAAGILDAYRRKEKLDFGLDFRFASYDPFNKTPQHVFVVIKENGKEYWLDPVLDEYDLKKQPYYYKDKKINKMALIALSGIGAYNPLLGYDPALQASASSTVKSTGWLDTILKAAPSIISAFPSGGGSGGVVPPIPRGGFVPVGNQNIPQSKSMGIDTNTILLVAGVGLAAYLLLKKK
jgi:hypothetical protein